MATSPANDGEFPTRGGTAAVLRDRYIVADATGRAAKATARTAHVGIVGKAGGYGRTRPADGYLLRLT